MHHTRQRIRLPIAGRTGIQQVLYRCSPAATVSPPFFVLVAREDFLLNRERRIGVVHTAGIAAGICPGETALVVYGLYFRWETAKRCRSPA